MHWTDILTFGVVLGPALLCVALGLLCAFPLGRVLWDNVVSLDVLQHLALHSFFYAPAAAVIFFKFVLTGEEQTELGTYIKFAGILSSVAMVVIGWLCGYRVVQLETLHVDAADEVKQADLTGSSVGVT